MIVRDRDEDTWQLVRQPDHAELSGQLARAWGGSRVEPVRNAAGLALAATRHDDGWAIVDRRPWWDAERGRPLNFLDVPIRAHLAFYRACVEVVREEDPYAGLMVSMHAAGLYNGRFGAEGGAGLTYAGEHGEEVAAFVAEEERARPLVQAELGIDDAECWTNYRLLQVFDRLSLVLCLREWESSDATVVAVPRCPLDYAGTECELRLEPTGPWRLAVEPSPFAERPARFTLVRKVVLKGRFRSSEEFRDAYFSTRAEVVHIVCVPAEHARP